MIRALHKGGRCRCCKPIIVDMPEEPKRRPPAKKDKKRWCGGHVGREHDPQWEKPTSRLDASSMVRLTCAQCGKVLDYCWSWTAKNSGCKCGLHV